MKTFSGDKLRSIRDENYYSRRAVVAGLALLGLPLTEKTLGNWESGISEPKAKQLAGLASLFKVELGDFFCQQRPLVASTRGLNSKETA